jgi:hypothetical protein
MLRIVRSLTKQNGFDQVCQAKLNFFESTDARVGSVERCEKVGGRNPIVRQDSFKNPDFPRCEVVDRAKAPWSTLIADEDRVVRGQGPNSVPGFIEVSREDRRRAKSKQPTMVEDGNAVAKIEGLIREVGGEHNRAAFFGHDICLQKTPERPSRDRVQAPRRLVQQKDAWA